MSLKELSRLQNGMGPEQVNRMTWIRNASMSLLKNANTSYENLQYLQVSLGGIIIWVVKRRAAEVLCARRCTRSIRTAK